MRWSPFPSEDAVTIVEVIVEELECYIVLVDKSVAGIERVEFNFEGISGVDKMLLRGISCLRVIYHERRSQ